MRHATIECLVEPRHQEIRLLSEIEMCFELRCHDCNGPAMIIGYDEPVTLQDVADMYDLEYY